MKIGRLLEFHKKNQIDISLPTNLGDGFLVSKNSLFSAVRKKALSLEYRYSREPNPNYFSLPLSQLETILKNRTIPYADNVTVLLEIEKEIPGATDWDEVTDNLKKNHVFHESCHAIARVHASKIFKSALDRNSHVLRLLIEESFANTCELLGIIDVDDTAHRIFYELNSYIFMYEDRTQLKKLVSEIGQPSALKFLIGCYLFSNFLHEKFSEPTYNKMLNLFNLANQPLNIQKTLRSVSKIAFELNPRFRWVTTTFYLKLNGLPLNPSDLSAIDFLRAFADDHRFIDFIETLSHFDTV